MKVILDNIIYKKSNNGGISNYWYELTKYLMQINPLDTFFIDYSSQTNFHRNRLNLDTEKIINTLGFDNKLSQGLPIFLNAKDKFIFHSSYYRSLIGNKNKIEITTIHDFTHDYYFSTLKKKIHNYYKYNAIKRSKGLICVSQNTYSDLKKLVGVSKHQKVEVIYNGVSNDFFRINHFEEGDLKFVKKNKLNDEFLLFVGSRADYKNFDFVLRLLETKKDIKLVVVGNAFSEKEKQKIGKKMLDRVLLLSNVSNHDLNILYNLASAFIYPSSYEGFGIPLIESMKAGCPVLSLNNSSISEIASKGAILLNQLNVNDFSFELDQLKNTNYKQTLIEEGLEQSKKFSWEKTMKETYDFYQEAYESF